jgi:hypothetical protein
MSNTDHVEVIHTQLENLELDEQVRVLEEVLKVTKKRLTTKVHPIHAKKLQRIILDILESECFNYALDSYQDRRQTAWVLVSRLIHTTEFVLGPAPPRPKYDDEE